MTHLEEWRRARTIRQTKLPWLELEAEAQRQGCSPADIFYDRAGHGAMATAESRAAGRDLPPRPTSR